MRRHTTIIDISCNHNGAIESSKLATDDDSAYVVEGILHNVDDHTPAIFYKTATVDISNVLYPFLDMLVEEKCNETLEKALCIDRGNIIDKRIIVFQNR